MGKHRVVIYNWVEGRLHFSEKILESLEHALAFVENLVCHNSKIYDEHGVLVVVSSKPVNNTYSDGSDTYA